LGHSVVPDGGHAGV